VAVLLCVFRGCACVHAGQSVTQTVLIHNTGNVQLRDVNLTTTLSTATGAQAAALPAYSCQLDGGPSALTLPAALPQGSNLTCVTTYHFSNVQQIEAGDLHFDTMASAAALSEFIILPTKVVAVPGLPKFNMTLDAQACEAAQPSPNFAGGCRAHDKQHIGLLFCTRCMQSHMSSVGVLGSCQLMPHMRHKQASHLHPASSNQLLSCALHAPACIQGAPLLAPMH